MNKISLSILLIPAILFTLASCSCNHEWENATCTTPVTCLKCGETAGDSLGHTWKTDTCTSPKTCFTCGATEGETLGHIWTDATCVSPKRCSVCEITEGEATGHAWLEATCTIPKTCSICGITHGTANHTWLNAICTTPKICAICEVTEGEVSGHIWKNATCTTPQTCSVCGISEGVALGHTTDWGICTQCNESISKQIDKNNVKDFLKIYGIRVSGRDSVGGIDVDIGWENTSSKTIKYIHFFIEPYNAVGDKVRCEIWNQSLAHLSSTGPHETGYNSYFIVDYLDNGSPVWWGMSWENVWYNSDIRNLKIIEVRIEYMDGTELTIDKDTIQESFVN